MLWQLYCIKQSHASPSLLPQRLYREDYEKKKDKIHTTYDTPDIKQVKMNQEHLSDVRNHFHTIYVFCVPNFVHVARWS